MGLGTSHQTQVSSDHCGVTHSSMLFGFGALAVKFHKHSKWLAMILHQKSDEQLL